MISVWMHKSPIYSMGSINTRDWSANAMIKIDLCVIRQLLRSLVSISNSSFTLRTNPSHTCQLTQKKLSQFWLASTWHIHTSEIHPSFHATRERGLDFWGVYIPHIHANQNWNSFFRLTSCLPSRRVMAGIYLYYQGFTLINPAHVRSPTVIGRWSRGVPFFFRCELWSLQILPNSCKWSCFG